MYMCVRIYVCVHMYMYYIKGKTVPLHNGQAQTGGRGVAILISVPVIQRGKWSAPSPGLFSLGKETRFP
jgi:hypothetical protein